MSNIEKHEGIILGGHSFGESNKVINVITDNSGIISVVANGVRKTTSKFGGSMELMNIVSLLTRKSKSSDLYTVREAELVHSFHMLREQYETISNLYYISEFVSKFFKNDIPNIEVYNNLKAYLFFLEKAPGSINELRWYFVLNSLNKTGYLPTFEYCSNCNKKLDDKIYVSGRDGWIFCENCHEYKIDKKISVGAVNFLKMILDYRYDDIVRIKVTNEVEYEINDFLKSIIYGILGREIKSEKLINIL